MTIRSCQRDQCPGTWHIGRKMVWAGKVWELAEIRGDVYDWIEVRPAQPGESTQQLNEGLTIMSGICSAHKNHEVGCTQCEALHPSASCSNDLLYGGSYNFKNQPERLKYIGQHKGWHQFELIGKQGVWCELLDGDLHMIEETKSI